MPSLSENRSRIRVADRFSLQSAAGRAGISLRTLKRLFSGHDDFPGELLIRTKGGHRRLNGEAASDWVNLAIAYWRLLSRRSARNRSKGSLGTLRELLLELTINELARVHDLGNDSEKRLSWALGHPEELGTAYRRIESLLIESLGKRPPESLQVQLAKLLLAAGECRRLQHAEITPLNICYRTSAAMLNCSVGALRGKLFSVAWRSGAWRQAAAVDNSGARIREIAQREVGLLEKTGRWKSVPELMHDHGMSKETAEEVAQLMRAIADDREETSENHHETCLQTSLQDGITARYSREERRSPAVRKAQRRRCAELKRRLETEVMLKWLRSYRAPSQALCLVRISSWHALNKYAVDHRMPREMRREAFNERRRAGWIQTWATVEMTEAGWAWHPNRNWDRSGGGDGEVFATMAEAKQAAEKWLARNIELTGGLVFAAPPVYPGGKQPEYVRLPPRA